MGTTDFGIWYNKEQPFELVGYTDVDFAGDKIERKSTSGHCQFLGESLVSWACKKQNTIALSTTDAEYIAAASCCSQVLWIKQQLADFSVKCSEIVIHCDNTSAINLSKNPIQHSKSKHIDIKHHFLRDHVQKGDIQLIYIDTNIQTADIFTKPLLDERFKELLKKLNMSSLSLLKYQN